MSIIFADGFELQESTRWSTGAIVAKTTHKNGTPKYWMEDLWAPGVGHNHEVWFDTTPAQTQIYLSFNMIFDTLARATINNIGIYDEDENYLFRLRFTSDLRPFLQAGAGATSGEYDTPFNLGEMYSLTIISDMANDYTALEINGELALELYATIRHTNFGDIRKLRFLIQTTQIYWDDVFVTDDIGDFTNMGGTFIYPFAPSANGYYSDWIPEPTSSEPYQAVNAIPPDESTYVSSDTTNDKVSFGFPALSLGAGTKIVGIKQSSFLHKTTAEIENARSFIRIGGVDYAPSSPHVLENLAPHRRHDLVALATNPATGQAWVQAEIAQIEIGMTNE